jgi:hypothetical protein
MPSHVRPIGMRRSRSFGAAMTALLVGATLLGGCSPSGTAARDVSMSPEDGGGSQQPPSLTGDGTRRVEPPAAPEVRTIAKDDGVPPSGVVSAYGTVLVVPDDLVNTVLTEIGVEQLPRVDGEPLQTGRYADFTGADDLAADEVLVLWYSGQSGTCPSYLHRLRITALGDVDVDVETDDADLRACSADYNPYRQLVVVPEDALPMSSDLPLTLEGEAGAIGDDLAVDIYPALSQS